MPSKSDNPNPKKFDGNGEKSFKQRKPFNKEGGDKNNFSKRRDHPIRKGPPQKRLNGKVFNQGQPVCMYCLALGHVFKDCPEAEESVRNGKMCFNCGEMHPIKDCKKKRSKGLAFATCFVCKQKGHLAITCAKKPNPEQYNKYKPELRDNNNKRDDNKRKYNNNNTGNTSSNNTNNNTNNNETEQSDQPFEKDESRLKCLCCFQYGHIMHDCPTAPESMKTNNHCFNCGKTDHILRNCPEPKKTPYPFAICFVCQGQGHMANECPTRVRTKKGKKDQAPMDDTFQNSGTADDDGYTEGFKGNNKSNNNRPQGNRPFGGNRGGRPNNSGGGRYFGNKSQGNQGGKSFGQKPAQKPGQYKKFE